MTQEKFLTPKNLFNYFNRKCWRNLLIFKVQYPKKNSHSMSLPKTPINFTPIETNEAENTTILHHKFMICLYKQNNCIVMMIMTDDFLSYLLFYISHFHLKSCHSEFHCENK